MPLSPFWSEIMKLDSLGKISVTYEPGLHSIVEFWNFIWFGNCTISTKYPQLYNLCSNKNISIAEVMHSQGSVIHFRRFLVGILLSEWYEVLLLISTSSFKYHVHKISWWWVPSGQFTIRSIYKILNFRGINANKFIVVWELSIPPKIRIFL